MTNGGRKWNGSVSLVGLCPHIGDVASTIHISIGVATLHLGGRGTTWSAATGYGRVTLFPEATGDTRKPAALVTLPHSVALSHITDLPHGDAPPHHDEPTRPFSRSSPRIGAFAPCA